VRAGRAVPLQIDEETFEGVRSWIEKRTDEFGRVGYQQMGSGPARPADLMDKFPAELSESMTAVGMFLRVLYGEDPRTSGAIQKGANLCLKVAPRWRDNGSIDFYFWYYGTLAMSEVGGAAWTEWSDAVATAVADHQRRDGTPCDAKGSWDAV